MCLMVFGILFSLLGSLKLNLVFNGYNYFNIDFFGIIICYFDYVIVVFLFLF